MCTAISMGAYAGRNLDVDKSYGSELIITPRKYYLSFKSTPHHSEHFSFLGIGVRKNNYPLYFDAVNEHGLYIAGLNYVGNAKYRATRSGCINLAPYELIPYLLSVCKTVDDAEASLTSINLTDIPFDSDLPTARLHFFIADRERSIVAEPDSDGLNVYSNPVGVLTNNPPFPSQLFNLNRFAGLSNKPFQNRLSRSIDLKEYSNGMGAIGLPGDLSSESRFVRASFHRLNSQKRGDLCDMLHLLSSVEMPYGSVETRCGYEYTEYSSVADLGTATYCYKTYESLHVYAVRPSEATMSSDSLVAYAIKKETEPSYCNDSEIISK